MQKFMNAQTLAVFLWMSAISLWSLPALAAYGHPFEGSGFVSDDCNWSVIIP
ncbi:hypothetical protein ACS8FD_09660 [Psychrobacter sp. 1U2]|uniref:hypothetical protein n=1 Tax=Psychrobacter sp. 1U2 TaxID=3453577 RepID=UPI003F448A24